MAQLDVQPKRSNPWWLWLIIAIVAIAIILFLLKGCNHKTTQIGTTDSTSTTNSDSMSTKQTVAVMQPDWNSVNFNAPKSSDPDVTDKDIAVSGNSKYIIYTLGENILFNTDQSTLQGSADKRLQQITASINKHFKNASIGVYGNTDSTGTTGQNKQLGADRAAAVKTGWLKMAALTQAKYQYIL